MIRVNDEDVKNALLARCIVEWSKDSADRDKIFRAAQILFESLFGALSPNQKQHYQNIVNTAQAEEIAEFPLGMYGPN